MDLDNPDDIFGERTDKNSKEIPSASYSSKVDHESSGSFTEEIVN